MHNGRDPYEVVHDRILIFWKFFCPTNLKKGPKMNQKQGFLLKNLIIYFCWICSIMKTYIIWCVPAQIPYLGNFLFLRYGPKYSQPIRLQDSLINHISRTNQWNSPFFLHVYTNSYNQKLCKRYLVKSGCGQSGLGTLILTESRMNRWNELIFCMPMQIQES